MDLIKFLLLHQLLLVFFFNWLLIGFIVLNCLLHRSPAKKESREKKIIEIFCLNIDNYMWLTMIIAISHK